MPLAVTDNVLLHQVKTQEVAWTMERILAIALSLALLAASISDAQEIEITPNGSQSRAKGPTDVATTTDAMTHIAIQERAQKGEAADAG
jgi:hypothetical protein